MNNFELLPPASNKTAMSAHWAVLLTTLLAMLIFTPIIWRISISGYDYVTHAEGAVKMLTSRSLPSPHFLFPASIVTLQQLLSVSMSTASALVVLLAMAGTAALIFMRINAASKTLWISGILTICLMLVEPIPLLFPLDGKQYFGYIGINIYHNPTILLLKPFALLVFGFVFTRKAEDGGENWRSLLACLLATTACALAKPSFIIVIVPALAIAFSLPSLRKILVKRVGFIFFGIFLPALLLLAGQYWLGYSIEQLPGAYQGESGIILAPLAVMSYVSSWLLVKFFLSIAFPLAVAVGYFRQVLADTRLLFAWIAFLIGAAYTYFFAESGPRMFHGNFVWSGQITLFILFVVSVEFLCVQMRRNERQDRTQKIIFIVCMTFFVLHILSGINTYVTQYLGGGYHI